jgi:hypothetical protein
MDWLFANWPFDAGFGGPSAPSSQNYDRELRTVRTLATNRLPLSAVEMWLLRLAYVAMAAELSCGKCGAPLDRELRFVPPSDADPPSWRTLVVTRCSGWRRHRHTADVTESSKDLLLGLFRLN